MPDQIYTGFPNYALLERIELTPGARVLDLGCGGGDNARILRERGARVWGVTFSRGEAELAGEACEAVWVRDLNEDRGFEGEYDIVVASHVLEHLLEPGRTLARAARALRAGGRVYIAVPNMAHWDLRRRFLRGDWRREDRGPLDRTHVHFWSHATAPEMLEGSGLRLERQMGGDAKCPWRGISSFSRQLSRDTDAALGRRWPNLFAMQTLLVAAKAG